VISLNGNVVAILDGPRTLDGWIGFLVQDDVEFRNVRVSPAPSEPPSGIYNPGPDVSLPRLLHEQKPRYTADGLAEGIQGRVLVECVVEADGTVSRAVVVRSLDQEHGLDHEAVLAAKQWRFEPGLRMGQPVPVLVTIELNFAIRPR
jgi:protein TonB